MGIVLEVEDVSSIEKNIVIIGAGFAGLEAAKALLKAKNESVKLTLIDEKNHHLFQPLLYQVATAGLSPAEIAVPIRSILEAGRTKTAVMLDRVTGIDAVTKQITLRDGRTIMYDILILACGATHSYFGNESWEEFAPGLKTLEQATEIRRRILRAFELAESSDDALVRRELLTFVIVGGGPTGVELAGAIAEISRQTLAKDFHRIDPSVTRIILVEAGSRILSSFSEDLSRHAARDLEKLGVTVWTSMRVTDITADGVRLGAEFVRAHTVLWAAGIKPSSLGVQSFFERDKLGRVEIESTLLAKGHKDIFVLGDMASFNDPLLGVLPGLAPVAMQQGRHAAKNALRILRAQPLLDFKYSDKGQMATIGRRKAVSMFRGLELSGYIAWLSWLLVHVYYLVGFRNKLFVVLQWIGSYVFFKQGARLITNRGWKINDPT
jgi:NADH dehydrogenase